MISAFGHGGFDQRARAFRSAAQRRFVASMIACRPAALSFRFLRAGALDGAALACSLDAAHLFRWAAAILARAAADIRGLLGARVVLSVVLGAQHLAKFSNLSVESFLLFLETSDRGSDDLGVN